MGIRHLSSSIYRCCNWVNRSDSCSSGRFSHFAEVRFDCIADEADNTSGGETRLVIAKANQVGVTVFDMTRGVRKLISDAKVVITSHATKKSATVTTDSKGVALVDITDLAEAEGKKRQVPRYEFDGQIEVTKQGYRVFRAD